MSQYLKRNHREIDADTISEALEIVMNNNNIMNFGTTRWKQQKGTAMGVAFVPPYSNIYLPTTRTLDSPKTTTHPRIIEDFSD